MKFKILNILLLIAFIYPLKASDYKTLEELNQAWARDTHSLAYKIQEITKIEIDNIKKKTPLPQQSLNQRLRPILQGIQELGSETDPSVKVIMQAYRLFKCSLTAYYQPLPNDFSSQLVDSFHRVTKENFQRDVEFTAQFLNIVSQMVIYTPPKEYAQFFQTNIAENHQILLTLMKKRLSQYYPQYFTWHLVAGDEHNIVKFLKASYKTYKSYGFEMQGYLQESWQAHTKVLPKICPHHIGSLIPAIYEVEKNFKANFLNRENWKKNLITAEVKEKIEFFLTHPPHYFIIDETPQDLSGALKVLGFFSEPINKQTILTNPVPAKQPTSLEKTIQKDSDTLVSTSSASVVLETEPTKQQISLTKEIEKDDGKQTLSSPAPVMAGSFEEGSTVFLEPKSIIASLEFYHD